MFQVKKKKGFYFLFLLLLGGRGAIPRLELHAIFKYVMDWISHSLQSWRCIWFKLL